MRGNMRELCSPSRADVVHSMSSGDLLREWICSRSCDVHSMRQRHVLQRNGCKQQLDVHALRGRLVFEPCAGGLALLQKELLPMPLYPMGILGLGCCYGVQ